MFISDPRTSLAALSTCAAIVLAMSVSVAAPVGEATRIARYAYQTEAASGRSPVYRRDPIHERSRCSKPSPRVQCR